MFEADLFTFWQANLSATPVIHLSPGKLPPNPAFPMVTYQKISAPNEEVQEGPTGYSEDRIQFSVYDDDWLECWAAADRVKALFKRFRGNMGSTEVQSSRVDNDFDSGDPETGLPRRIVEVLIRHKES